jgi:hypothetical protein
MERARGRRESDLPHRGLTSLKGGEWGMGRRRNLAREMVVSVQSQRGRTKSRLPCEFGALKQTVIKIWLPLAILRSMAVIFPGC